MLCCGPVCVLHGVFRRKDVPLRIDARMKAKFHRLAAFKSLENFLRQGEWNRDVSAFSLTAPVPVPRSLILLRSGMRPLIDPRSATLNVWVLVYVAV